MNKYDKFYKAVSIRIDPTFDKIESFCDKHPKLALPICFGLAAAFPAWCALANFVHSRREL